MGRLGIDPVVYFKMLLTGFFLDLPSERAIAERCQDSIAIRAFLKYSLTEETPDHSSLTRIRQRLSLEIYEGIFQVVLRGLQAQGLLRGKRLGVDSSAIEANASLSQLLRRKSGEDYWTYVKGLAKEAGIDVEKAEEVREFDRKRPGKTLSNQEWENPHEPEAKVGRAKDGATDMLYKSTLR